ncbi:RNA splicing protein mrs2 [Pochonia chlamydosporia 170]|uniref:Magnesium transporter n=1 Tax=Pochonia chlamydosporia 170 TaxID=1380566 RepID=A0A179FIE9_METCM|nr:RNA splicing protein mrs2 [Pochonia chlamydosporia 170]OAQ65405.1 RNA splicing protein mrs2 [Pochonia chlamydosporia 170]
MNGNVNMQFTQFDSFAAAALKKNLTKVNIAHEYGLSARDLRIIDLPSNGFPHILIRENTLLIHMFDLRLLVQADKVVLFEVNGIEDNITCRVFTHDLETKLHKAHALDKKVNDSFELRALDIALASVAATLEAEYLLVKQDVSKALKSLDQQMSDKEGALVYSALRGLLDISRKLARIEQRARLVRNAIQEVLNDDADMAQMYLTDKLRGKRHLVHEHQEVEYLLEAYFKANDAIAQEAASLVENIQRTEETIKSILDVRRNQIMMLEAKVEIAMLSLASATLVAGWYGMNVISYFEHSPWAFGVLVSGSLVGSALIWRFVIRRLRLIQRRTTRKE